MQKVKQVRMSRCWVGALVVVLALFLGARTAQAEWLSGWDQRISLTIDSSKIDAALSDFPVLVHLSASSGITGADVSAVFDELTSDANRKKIAVTKSDGTTQCYVEIEDWDDASEKAWLWVKVSGTNSIASGTDTVLYLYYDADHADNTTYVGDSGSRTEVWDSNYVAVWHMDDTTTSTITDSTGNDLDGSKKGGNEPAEESSGKVGPAQNFDGTDDEITVSHNSVFNTTDQTIEVWFYLDGSVPSSDAPGFVYKGPTSPGADGSYQWVFSGSDSKLWYGLWGDATKSNNTTWSADTWYHAVITFDDSANTTVIYLDGQTDITDTGMTESTDASSYGVKFGHKDDGGYFLDGLLDEIRISSVARSAAWIKASFNTGNDSLITFGSPEPYSTQTHYRWRNDDGTESVFKVQNYQGSIGSATSKAVSIAAVDLDHAFILAPAGSMSAGTGSVDGDQNADEVLVRARFTDADEVTLTRGASTNDSYYSFSVVEDTSGEEIYVDSGSYTFTTDTQHDVTVSGITDYTDTVVFLTVSSGSASRSYYNEARVRGRMTSNTNLRLSRSSGNTSVTVDWFVVEFTGDGWSVQQGDFDLTTGTDASPQTQSISSVTTADSFVFMNWEANTNGLDQSTAKVELTDATTLSFSRYATTSTTTQTYDTATTGTSWEVPSGVTSITVKGWGAGGGGGGGGDVSTGGNGGGGGFAQATLSVTASETLTIRVGGGGGGGSGGAYSGDGGGGGGYSGIFRDRTPLIIAAGGGGAGGGDNSSATAGGSGGGGGGNSGSSGNSSSNAGGGGGGTQDAGGAGGTGGANSGSAGSSLTGGAGANGISSEGADGGGAAGGTNGGGNGGRSVTPPGGYAGGGGGGGGYFGGGGGSASASSDAGGGGGGGGSSYLTGTSTSTSSGSGRNAGNNSDDDYTGSAGYGGGGGSTGGSGGSGNDGLVVISYGEESNAVTCRYFVVSHSDLSVQRGDVSTSDASDYEVNTSVTAVAPDQAFPLSFNDCDGTGEQFPRPYWRSWLSDSETLYWERERSGQLANFHWQVIDLSGFGGAATWAEDEDTKLVGLGKDTTRRLRFQVLNDGGSSSGAVTYKLQVAETDTCGSGTYTDVSTGTGGDWQIVGSSYITDGEATTNIGEGLTDPTSCSFVAGELKDTGNTTGGITLGGDEFTEIEFAVKATDNATSHGDYCFRLYDATNTAPLDSYSAYAQVSLEGPFLYRKSITIDKDQVACASMSDFPLLVNISSDNDLRTVANGGHVEHSSGYDILFRDTDGKTQLDHEIEKYDPATGQLVAWVRIPTLTSSTDKVIYMYCPVLASPLFSPAFFLF